MQNHCKFEKNLLTKIRVQYLLFAPQGYKARGTKKWPLILFLHGAGERGTVLSKVAAHGPPKIVENKPHFPFLVVSPQCPTGQAWSEEVLMSLLDEIIAKHAVDKNRVYLTGLSMGGYGAWMLATQRPECWAAVAPICGGGHIVQILLATGTRKKALQSLPIWAFHGAKDSVVPVAESEKMVNAFNGIGAREVHLTVYPDAEHDSWSRTYENPQLYDWFLAHKRRQARKATAPYER